MSHKGVFVLFSVTPHNSNNLSDDILIIYTESCYNFVWSLKNSHQKKIWNLKISNTWHGNVLFFDKRSRLIEIFHKHLILQIRFFTKKSNLQTPQLTMYHYILKIFRLTLLHQMILNIHIMISYFPILTLYTVTKCAICWRGKLSFVSPAFCRKFDVTVNYIVQKVGGEHGK